jgi:hypothetical protein
MLPEGPKSKTGETQSEATRVFLWLVFERDLHSPVAHAMMADVRHRRPSGATMMAMDALRSTTSNLECDVGKPRVIRPEPARRNFRVVGLGNFGSATILKLSAVTGTLAEVHNFLISICMSVSLWFIPGPEVVVPPSALGPMRMNQSDVGVSYEIRPFSLSRKV